MLSQTVKVYAQTSLYLAPPCYKVLTVFLLPLLKQWDIPLHINLISKYLSFVSKYSHWNTVELSVIKGNNVIFNHADWKNNSRLADLKKEAY